MDNSILPMNDIRKDEKQAKMDAIFHFAEEIKTQSMKLQDEKEQIDIMKEELRGLMADLDLKFLKNEEWSISVRTPVTIDHFLLEDKYPRLYKAYVTEEVVTKTKYKVDKKALEELHPDAYHEAKAEGTPRLYIKHLKELPDEVLFG